MRTGLKAEYPQLQRRSLQKRKYHLAQTTSKDPDEDVRFCN